MTRVRLNQEFLKVLRNVRGVKILPPIFKELQLENFRLTEKIKKLENEKALFEINLGHLRSQISDVEKPFWSKSIPSYINKNSEDLLPPQKLFNRIAGQAQLSGDQGEQQFLESGFQDAKEIGRIYEIYTGKKIQKGTSILDWGCGLGRILRHFKSTDANLFGMDVDGISLTFCSENYQFSKFLHISPNSTNFFKGKKFDLIYGFSVMTHLSEQDQMFWLEQLSLILKKRGLLLLTIHGPSSVLKHSWSFDQELLQTYFEQGHVSGVANDDIRGQVPDGYYRDAATTHAFVKKRWSAYFEIMDIISAGLGQSNGLSEQDLVVMRYKGS